MLNYTIVMQGQQIPDIWTATTQLSCNYTIPLLLCFFFFVTNACINWWNTYFSRKMADGFP